MCRSFKYILRSVKLQAGKSKLAQFNDISFGNSMESTFRRGNGVTASQTLARGKHTHLRLHVLEMITVHEYASLGSMSMDIHIKEES